MNKKVVFSKTTVHQDANGKTVLSDESKTFTIKLDDSDKFFMVYYNMMKSFYQIKYVKDVMLLIKLVELADYNTGVITLATKTRESLCKDLDVAKSNLSSMFKRLVELQLIFGEKGVYTINECVFWKGDAVIRRDLLKTRGLEFILKFTL